MTRLAALLLLAALPACGAEDAPEPVTPGITASGGGVDIDIGGTATIGVSGTF